MAIALKPENVVLNQAVARNRKRFPSDFIFQLSAKEYENLRSQIVTTSGEEKANSTQTGMTSQIVISKEKRAYGAPLRSQFVISKLGRGGQPL